MAELCWLILRRRHLSTYLWQLCLSPWTPSCFGSPGPDAVDLLCLITAQLTSVNCDEQEANIYIFVTIMPVTMDAYFKL